ncbi:MAG: GNAT family N-acetyltransferase [Parerythrobacter sp.]
MTSVNYHSTVNGLQVTAAPSGPFARADWFALLAEREAAPLFVQAVDGSDTAMMALAKRDERLEALANWYSFNWQPDGAERLWTGIAADLRREHAHIVLTALPETEAQTLREAFQQAGWRTQLQACDHNHVLRVRGRSFAEYWAERPGRMRTTLRRKAKKVSVRILNDFDDGSWRNYESIYAKSWKPAEGDPALLRTFATQEAAAGRMRLGIAYAGERAVAAQFWTVEDGTAYIHKLAHLEADKALSAGTTLTAALFEHVIDTDRVAMVDFGTGNDPYKRDWMEEVRLRYRLECFDPATPRIWPAILAHAARKARQRLARNRRER